MTNKEYREAYKLDEREKAQIWQNIRTPFAPGPRHTRRWVPALGGLAAAACAVTVAVLLTNDGRGPAPVPVDVAVRSSEAPVAAPPAADLRPESVETKPASTVSESVVAGDEDFAGDDAVQPPAESKPEETLVQTPVATRDDTAATDAVRSRASTAKTRYLDEPAAARRVAVTASPTGVVHGIVRDQETGEVLAGAIVVVVGTKRSALTDDRGEFVIGGLPAGDHTLEVRYLGYATADQNLTIAVADTVQANYALASVIVGTLQASDVDAARYMVETKNTTTSRGVGREKFERYAIDSVEDALSRESGIIMRDGQTNVRGGRSGEVQTKVDDDAAARSWRWGSVKPLSDAGAPSPESGGTNNPNDRPYDLVYHQHYGVNPFVPTEEDALSTFAIEVDDASWSIARRYLEDGNRPPQEAVRLEEIVNRLDAGLRHRGDDDFSLHVDGMPSRFEAGYQLVRVGVRARDIAPYERRPAHLVFVIDVSGSMNRENRLGLVKRSLRVLVDQLQEGDRVGIVTYGSDARMVLRPTGAEDRGRILAAIEALQSGGSTNAEAGLRMAYELARGMVGRRTNNRLILCSDGVANVGKTGPESILRAVRDRADEGITLTTVGFGMGNYNDVLMEQLADQGDGTYHYVHRFEDAQRVFRENLSGTLESVGREVKVQVEFDPERISRWRLLGYENRDVRDEDFRNDSVDAGDIGVGHTAVALYEVKLTEDAETDIARGWSLPLGTLRLRWTKPPHDRDRGQVTEIKRGIMSGDLAERWSSASPRLRLAAVAAEFAEILRGSFWAKDGDLRELARIAREVGRDVERDADVVDLVQMIQRAADLEERVWEED